MAHQLAVLRFCRVGRKIRRSARFAIATPGDTLIVKAGAYDELVTVSVSGQKDKLVTLRAEAPHTARVKGFVLEGDYISIEGFEITSDAPKANGIFVGEAHYKTAREGCRMIGNYIHDIGGTRSTLTPGGRVEDVATLAVGFASGAQCSVVGDFHSGRSSDRFVLAGGEPNGCSGRDGRLTDLILDWGLRSGCR